MEKYAVYLLLKSMMSALLALKGAEEMLETEGVELDEHDRDTMSYLAEFLYEHRIKVLGNMDGGIDLIRNGVVVNNYDTRYDACYAALQHLLSSYTPDR